MSTEEITQKIFELEQVIIALLDQISILNNRVETLQAHVEEKTTKLVYGTKRTWDDEQHSFLRGKYTATTDLSKLCEMHNTEFGPRGYAERSPTAIACQLYKIINHDSLTTNIMRIAEKYMK
jgi:hypothetical protein